MSLYIKGIIMKNIIALFIISMLVFGFSSCKKNPVEPDLEPGRRDYTWTADTINSYMDGVFRIGGTSINSLWAVGPSGNGNTIRKYNGQTWSAIANPFTQDAATICCLGDNNVWATVAYGSIWHYDGTWKQTMEYTESDVREFLFQDFYANTSNDIFLAGVAFYNNNLSRGVIMHYQNNKWVKEYNADDNSDYIRINKDVNYPDHYFIYSLKWSQKSGQGDTTTYLKYDGNRMETIYSEQHFNNGGSLISQIGGRLYFGMKDGIYRYNDNQLKRFIQMPVSNSDWHMPFGRSEKDFFISDETGILHYNGTDTQRVINYGQTGTYLDAVVFDKDVFILSTPNFSKFIIYHGTLKN
jgi:hypothetical protein